MNGGMDFREMPDFEAALAAHRAAGLDLPESLTATPAGSETELFERAVKAEIDLERGPQ